MLVSEVEVELLTISEVRSTEIAEMSIANSALHVIAISRLVNPSLAFGTALVIQCFHVGVAIVSCLVVPYDKAFPAPLLPAFGTGAVHVGSSNFSIALEIDAAVDLSSPELDAGLVRMSDLSAFRAEQLLAAITENLVWEVLLLVLEPGILALWERTCHDELLMNSQQSVLFQPEELGDVRPKDLYVYAGEHRLFAYGTEVCGAIWTSNWVS
jgi:hypothetical protein